ncbi:CCR4-Not complex subunit Caf16 [Schizosaccharomyces japonicus yFS275]|uniref:CCR4-Not complex subunit Caf16 n=1 Tax=Schizosaccharomyces japonicus (strain yFS275 / FY16936) TaxID=402676 RepID=B6JZB5_SCHJY|nr:CCR4-Not complex subunit Caf16 [Schizosaccharomyces japonicus yFS275]EEB06883.1 CCR4-Not complex subunit Caf16 [Schizosaccharomyces japonicus yFS275]
MSSSSNDLCVHTDHLSYSFAPNLPLSLHDVSVKFPKGSRTLLVGANGAGKSTLLKLLAGKTIANAGKITVNGSDPFRETNSGIIYLGTEWVTNPVVHRDMDVVRLIASIGGDLYPERRDKLIKMLDIDLRWRMHAVSDGERRRVQLCMGLIRPFEVLLLDEVTVDLDVLARYSLLEFLREETQSRNATIVYATHIFDGIGDWPTQLVHLSLGRIVHYGPISELVDSSIVSQKGNSRLLEVCLYWLQQDRKLRGDRGQENRATWDDVKEHLNVGINVFTDYFKRSRGL